MTAQPLDPRATGDPGLLVRVDSGGRDGLEPGHGNGLSGGLGAGWGEAVGPGLRERPRLLPVCVWGADAAHAGTGSRVAPGRRAEGDICKRRAPGASAALTCSLSGL